MTKPPSDVTLLKVAVEDLGKTMSALLKQQALTNENLKKLVDANNSFIGTLTVFLDQDHQIKLTQERKRLEQAKKLEATEHDLRY